MRRRTDTALFGAISFCLILCACVVCVYLNDVGHSRSLVGGIARALQRSGRQLLQKIYHNGHNTQANVWGGRGVYSCVRVAIPQCIPVVLLRRAMRSGGCVIITSTMDSFIHSRYISADIPCATTCNTILAVCDICQRFGRRMAAASLLVVATGTNLTGHASTLSSSLSSSPPSLSSSSEAASKALIGSELALLLLNVIGEHDHNLMRCRPSLPCQKTKQILENVGLI